MLLHQLIQRLVPRRAVRQRQTSADRLIPGCERLEPRMLLSAANAPFIETGNFDTTHILVGFDQQALATGQPMPALEGTKIGEAVSAELGLYLVELDTGVSVEDAVAAYAASTFVAYAQPDYEIHLNLIPNDPSFGSLWGLQTIGAPTAWDTTTGSSQIVVAVVDTGIDYNHPDLAANIWSNTDEIAGNGIDDDGNGYIDDIRGWDFYSNDNNPIDDNNHGTHVAGTIGGVGNNAIGVVGVNWNVSLMPLKFLGASGSGSTSAAVAAINYARQNGADIVNASWGGGGFSSALSNAIQAFHNGGGIFVAAAGNSASNNDSSAFYPANYANVVSVAATTSSDTLASFSSYGVNTVEIAAPGAGILSTVRNGGYASFSGTSMATPHVAGAMALVWAAHPTWTNTQVVDAILNSADPILLNRVTHGRLNVAAAIGDIDPPPGDVTGPRVTQAAWSGPQVNSLNSIRVTFDESVNPGSFDATDVSLTGPGGTISVQTVTPVSGSNNTQFDLAFATQTAAGTYGVSIGPDLTDTAGNLMNQDGDGTNGEPTQDVFTGTVTINSTVTFSWTGNAPIRDNRVTLVSLSIGDNLTIDDLNVSVQIQHTWDSDLGVAIIDPFGVGQWLIYRRGGSGNNIYATFDDEASTPISAGSAPFNGTFRPESSLADFDGESTQGTWMLYVADYAKGDRGKITGFSLIVTPRAGAALFEQPADTSGDSPAATSESTPILLLLDFGGSATPSAADGPTATPFVVGAKAGLPSAALPAADSPRFLDDDSPADGLAAIADEEATAFVATPVGIEDRDAVFRDFESALRHGLLSL